MKIEKIRRPPPTTVGRAVIAEINWIDLLLLLYVRSIGTRAVKGEQESEIFTFSSNSPHLVHSLKCVVNRFMSDTVSYLYVIYRQFALWSTRQFVSMEHKLVNMDNSCCDRVDNMLFFHEIN